MRLWELFEEITSQEIKNVQQRMNRLLYMPPAAVKQGGAVIKLLLPAGQHFGDRASGDRGIDQNFTAKELESLLIRARTDPSLGYANIIRNAASWQGPGDYDPHGSGIKIKDPETGLMIPFVVKPNTDAQQEVTSTTVKTANGLEPRNIFKAKTIVRKAPGVDDPLRPSRPPSLPSNKAKAKQSKIDPRVGYFTSRRSSRPDFSDYDDGSTD